jgi:two-component system, LytTR family, response regulator AlgR
VSAALRVLVVDDEALARARLCSLVAQCVAPSARVVAEFGQAQEALTWLQQTRCDVVLLDIQMPGLDGLVLAQQLLQLPKGQVPSIVFVTAHAEHALQAFELEALDYLTKPVRLERLQAALARVHAQGVEPEPPQVLVVTESGRKIRVPLDDILYLKAELKYVTLRTAGHTYLLDGALTDFEQRLGERFLRVHRNALVARKAMLLLERRVLSGVAEEASLDTWCVKVARVEEWLAVSRRQVPAVKEAIEQGAV